MRRYLGLIILSGVVLSANFWGHSIYLLDEAKNAECAREMLETGNWIVPTFNYELRTDKPPIHYYFMMLAYSIFGVNAFAARFFSIVFGVLTVLLIDRFCIKNYDKRTANFTTLTLLSSIGFIVQFHLAVPDPYLVFFIVTSILAFFKGFQNRSDRYYLLSAACMALASLVKGPIGFLLPLAAVVSFLFVNKRASSSSLIQNPKAVVVPSLVFLSIAMPWYVAVGFETDWAWIKGFFLEHNVNRFLSPKEGHGGFFLLILLYFLALLMPLGLFIFPALSEAFNRKKDSFDALALITIGFTILIFSFSATKLPNYVSPAVPFGAILIGRYLADLSPTRNVLLPIAVSYLVLSFMLVWGIEKGLSSEIALQPIADLNALKVFWLIPIGAVIGLIVAWKKLLLGWLIVNTVSFGLTLQVAFYNIIPEIDKLNPVSQFASNYSEEDKVVAYQIYNPAFNFYLKNRIPVYIDLGDLDRVLLENNSTVVLTRDYHLPELKVLKLDTLLIQNNLFDGSTSAVLLKKKK
ncbi:MAG: glycosyltransferase family 39 protein [Cyclobacteriaceae bacterium]